MTDENSRRGAGRAARCAPSKSATLSRTSVGTMTCEAGVTPLRTGRRAQDEGVVDELRCAAAGVESSTCARLGATSGRGVDVFHSRCGAPELVDYAFVLTRDVPF